SLGARVFVQVGAGNVVSSFAKATLRPEERPICVSLASREDDGLATLAGAVGSLWTAGVPLDPLVLFEDRGERAVSSPPSPIETQSYWPIERTERSATPIRSSAPAQPLEGESMAGKDQDGLVALF